MLLLLLVPLLESPWLNLGSAILLLLRRLHRRSILLLGGLAVHWSWGLTWSTVLRSTGVGRTVHPGVYARAALHLLLGTRHRRRSAERGLLLGGKVLRGLAGVQSRHIVRNDAPPRVQLDTDARARGALLVRRLRRDGNGALAHV